MFTRPEQPGFDPSPFSRIRNGASDRDGNHQHRRCCGHEERSVGGDPGPRHRGRGVMGHGEKKMGIIDVLSMDT